MSKRTHTALALGAAVAAALLAVPAAQAAQGDWIVRGGFTLVSPKSNSLVIPGFDEGTPDTPTKPAPGSLVLNVDDGSSFGFNITYMMTDNLGVELLAAVPFKHDIEARVQDVTTNEKIAETKHLPPTLSLQYHFMPDQKVNPYVGAGVNWTLFSSEKIDPALGNKLTLDDSFGVALQLGADVAVNERWLVNFDVRWINIETEAEVTDDIGTSSLGTVKIDPLVYSIMIGYKF